MSVTKLLSESYRPTFTWDQLVSSPCMAGKPLPALPPHRRLDMPCHILHAGVGCRRNFSAQFLKAYRAALGVYTSLQLVQLLAFRRKHLVQAPVATLSRMANVVTRSSLFLTMYSVGAWGTHCFGHSVLRVHQRWVLALAGAIGGSSIIIEPPSRRPELAL